MKPCFLTAIFLVVFASVCIGSSSKKSLPVEKEPVKKSILFVGNSLTYTNDLPSLVVAFAAKRGIEVTTTTLAKPNYALEDHCIEGEIQQLVATRKFDFVVVQQGPSSQAEGRGMLLDYGQRISYICRAAKSKLVFFMVWPARHNLHMFDGVIKNYSDAASATGALLCPVGFAWKKHFDETNDYDYYGPDNFHPSLKGSEVAAEIIVNSLF